MSLSRRVNCVRVFCLASALLIGAVGSAFAQEEASPGDDPSNPNYRTYTPNQPKVSNLDRDRLIAEQRETLNALKPTFGVKADNDFFVVGTISLKDHKADVQYTIKEGLQEAAEFIVDFTLDKQKGEIRDGRVFGRAKTMVAAEAIEKQARAQSVEGQLSLFKLSVRGKRSPDDSFVIGTADMNCATLHADIRFEVLCGVKSAADFIIDFQMNRPQNHKGEWHVFWRVPTEDEAIAYRQQMRDWYDNLEKQRSQIAAIYKARTTARC